jgi:hypothetical protein
VLREVERRLGLAETMTAPLADDRNQTRVLYKDGLARLIHEGVRGEMMGGDEAVGLA